MLPIPACPGSAIQNTLPEQPALAESPRANFRGSSASMILVLAHPRLGITSCLDSLTQSLSIILVPAPYFVIQAKYTSTASKSQFAQYFSYKYFLPHLPAVILASRLARSDSILFRIRPARGLSPLNASFTPIHSLSHTRDPYLVTRPLLLRRSLSSTQTRKMESTEKGVHNIKSQVPQLILRRCNEMFR